MKKLLFVVLLSAQFFFPELSHAYIGPGAGFAFLGSTFVFLMTFVLAILTIAFWPLQLAYRKITGKGFPKKAKAKRVIILGLDGLEPSLVEKYIEEGKLPNMKKLKETGSYQRLGTTLPALSPVAWSTFQTGVNPGAHNIFDFLTRDKRFCLPELSSTKTEVEKRSGFISKFFPAKATVKLMRKSQPFWKILGKHGVFSNILRVPISYPPEKFSGNILSAMCTPDLRGTQGTFSLYTNKENVTRTTGGEFKKIAIKNSIVETELVGPTDPKSKEGKPLTQKFTLEIKNSGEALLKIGKTQILLKVNQFSEWVEVNFSFGFNKSISGICRFCLRSIEPDLFLYVTPININPEKPALPIASPIFFSNFIAKTQGLFGTLGLMEDTWGRNEYALDDKRFLEQSYLTHNEREVMFFDMLEKTKQGLCVCVFDASDRIQHMFWRYLDDKHPSPKENAEFKDAIPDMYKKMDELVGKTMAKLRKGDAFIILSDHGFASFRRCINLNTWLLNEGYLVLKNGNKGSDYLQDVDWTKTKAFALGLSGLYINKKGRERNGIVEDNEAERLKKDISVKLEALNDPQDNAKSIRKVHDTAKAYKGLYQGEAPDLIVGYNPGYRVSWDSITGMIENEVFSDNIKAWSGDHHVDPEIIPGIFFSNLKVVKEQPNIVDIAPSVLEIFSVPVPAYMEGRSLFS
jgi:predicted AlkP superfamily phosphohydrolase/phosphomutase